MSERIPGLKRNLLRRLITDPIEGLGVGLALFIFLVLPLHAAEKTGACLGSIVGIFARGRNRIALFNLKIAFPDKTEEERKKILKQMWRHFGRLIADLPHNRQVLKEASFEGIEHLRKAYTEGKGGFVCSAHIGNWELSIANQVAPGFVMNPVYRPANNLFWINYYLLDVKEFIFQRGVLGRD